MKTKNISKHGYFRILIAPKHKLLKIRMQKARNANRRKGVNFLAEAG